MTTEIGLLPLPEGEASSFGNYEVHDNEAMVAYARANIARAVAPLQAEIERLRKDAARYRWLRDREIPEWLDLWHQNPDRIDAAIDEAMEKEVSND